MTTDIKRYKTKRVITKKLLSDKQLVINDKKNNLEFELINRQQRLQKAEEISDNLEFSVDKLDDTMYQNILQEIINKITQEEDQEIKEVLLNSVANALSYRDCIKGLDLSNLTKIILSLNTDDLIHALDIIGLSRNKEYIDLIKPFLKHSFSEVRETAKIALEEIAYKT